MSNTDRQKTTDTSSMADSRVSSGTLLATPRTDEVAVMVNGMARAYLCEETWKEAVEADFARELERENARLRELAGKLLEDLKHRTPDRADSSLPEWEKAARRLGISANAIDQPTPGRAASTRKECTNGN